MSSLKLKASHVFTAPGLTTGVPVKLHTSALAVVPPIDVWCPVQAIRCLRDKSFVRWPPHINLLYPFFSDISNRGDAGRHGNPPDPSEITPHFHHLALRASRALSKVDPFRVRLERLRTFRHSARSFTVWVDPVVVAVAGSGADGQRATDGLSGGGEYVGGGGGDLVEMQRLLALEFPECGELSRDEGRGIDGFVPHLSLGQLRDEDELQALQATWAPVEFTVDSVQLISRKNYLSPFTVRYQVPLGGAAPVPFLAGWDGRTAASDQADPDQHGVQIFLPEQEGSNAAVGGDSFERNVRRLDVPYVATLANLSRGGGEKGVAAGLGGARRRFASAVLVDVTRRTLGASGLPSADTREGTPAANRPRGIKRAHGGPHVSPHGPLDRGRSTAGDGFRLTAVGAQPKAASTAQQEALEALQLEGAGGNEAEPMEGDAEGGSDGGGDGGGVSAGASAASPRSISASDGPQVWWFAYGAATSCRLEEVGAVGFTAARVPGYRLAFNRRGGRANLVLVPGPAPQISDCPQQRQHQLGGVTDEEQAVIAKSLGGGDPAADDTRGHAAVLQAAPAAASGGPEEAGKDAGSQAGVHQPEAHGVLFRLPLERLARLLLATGDACPVEVVCQPYGNAASDGAGAFVSGSGTAASASASAGPPDAVVAVALVVSSEGCLAAEMQPAERYVAKLSQACTMYGIDAGFRSWLEGLTRTTAAERAPPIAPDQATGAAGTQAVGSRGAHRRGTVRTGAEKAAAGLPRALLDW